MKTVNTNRTIVKLSISEIVKKFKLNVCPENCYDVTGSSSDELCVTMDTVELRFEKIEEK